MTAHLHLRWLTLLAVLALAHGWAYALITPLWQLPDEPLLFEYAALTAELGRVPEAADRSPALEERLLGSLWRAEFWRRNGATQPAAAPRTLAEAGGLFWMPRQVGGDPPLAFALAALPLRLAAGWPIESQALLLRMLGAALLPCAVCCTYGAGRARAGADPRSPVPLAAAALVALQPMAAAIGASVSNDGLANLLGAALCWAWLSHASSAHGARRAALGTVGMAALLALGLLTKRTLLPYALALGAAAALWLVRHALRPGRRGLGMAGVAALAAALALWTSGQLEGGTALGWYRFGGHEPAPRVWSAAAGGPALVVPPGQSVVHPLPAAAGDTVRGGAFRFGARVWSDGRASGRLVVLNDDRRAEVRFDAGPEPAPVETSASVYAATRGVAVALQADSGTLYADGIWAEGGGAQMIPAGLALPGLRPGSPLLAAAGYARLPEIAWALTGGRSGRSLPAGWGALLFASFWGHFGWMNVPFVLGSPWMWALGVFCAAGAAGLPLAVWRAPAARRAALLRLTALAAAALLLPLINGLAMPANQALQQGRYLFPALAPLALLMASGQLALVPERGRAAWLIAWCATLATLAAAALTFVWQHYA